MSVILETRGVTKIFGKMKAVNDVSIKVHSGEIIGLVGPNGAGKSTFFSTISGYHHADEGEILFEGKNITKNKAYESTILGLSRTFQIVKPFGKMTVLENVMVGSFLHTTNPQAARDKAREVVVRMNMEKKMNSLANQLTLPERKRLEIARALATEPKLLMLDEVMAGLNRTEVDEFLPVIREINAQGTTIVIVEHVMYVVMSLAQRIVVLNEGKKIAEGTAEEIGSNENVINAYLGEEYLLAKS